MPRLSILIPCIQEAGHFEATLASVLQNRPPDCEILVIQPRGYDDPYELREEVRFVETAADSTLIDLINVGVAVAKGQIVHVLSCEVEVREGWTRAALQHFEDPRIAAVAPVIVAKRAPHAILARGVAYASGQAGIVGDSHGRRRSNPWNPAVLAPTLLAGLYRREALLEVGGFSREVGTAYADVDLGLMLRDAGYRCVAEEQAVVVTDQARPRPCLSFECGRYMERLFWRNAARSNRGIPWLAHAWSWLAEGLTNLPRPALALHMLGRLQGWREQRNRSRQQHLSEPAEPCDKDHSEVVVWGSLSLPRSPSSGQRRMAA